MRLIPLFLAFLVAAWALPGAAADDTPVRVRGTVAALDGDTLVVKSRAGETLRIALAADAAVNAVVAATLADVKAGSFIGTAAVPGTDGRLHAQEVLIFPEALRGAGEGHRPWDLTPDSTMTNASVAEVAGLAEGGLLKLKYKDGEQELAVAPDTPVVTLAPADRGLLQPGTAVFVPARRAADGTLAAGVVIAGRDGVNPPM